MRSSRTLGSVLRVARALETAARSDRALAAAGLADAETRLDETLDASARGWGSTPLHVVALLGQARAEDVAAARRDVETADAVHTAARDIHSSTRQALRAVDIAYLRRRAAEQYERERREQAEIDDQVTARLARREAA